MKSEQDIKKRLAYINTEIDMLRADFSDGKITADEYADGGDELIIERSTLWWVLGY